MNGMRIPADEVEAPVLKKVVEFPEYRRKQETTHMTAEECNNWEAEFVEVDKAMLFAIIRAANFLDVQPLLDLGCKTVADMMKGKTAAQVNEEFAIPKGTHLY